MAAAYVPERNFFDGFGRDVLPVLRIGGHDPIREQGRPAKAPLQGLPQGLHRRERHDILVVEARSGEAGETHSHGHRRHQAANDNGCPLHIVEDGVHLEDEDIQGGRGNRDESDAFWHGMDRREAHLRRQKAPSHQAEWAEIRRLLQEPGVRRVRCRRRREEVRPDSRKGPHNVEGVRRDLRRPHRQMIK